MSKATAPDSTDAEHDENTDELVELVRGFEYTRSVHHPSESELYVRCNDMFFRHEIDQLRSCGWELKWISARDYGFEAAFE